MYQIFGNMISLFPDAYGAIRDWFAVEAKYTRFLETRFPCFRTLVGRSVIGSQLWGDMPNFRNTFSLFPDSYDPIRNEFAIMTISVRFLKYDLLST